MPASDSPAILVARFLQANNYAKTLEAFIQEAGLPPDAGESQASDLTIEKVLQEKKVFDLSISFEKVAVEDEVQKWNEPAPSKASVIESLPTRANPLFVSVENVIIPDQGTTGQVILATAADRRLHILSPDPTSFKKLGLFEDIQDSPPLCCRRLKERYLLCTSMSGKLVLLDCESDVILGERRDHTKYAVTVATHESPKETWIATAGWDRKVILYRVDTEKAPISLEEPLTSVTLPSNPEALLFLTHPVMKEAILVVTRRDSNFLYYYSIRNGSEGQPGAPSSLQLLGQQNLAPDSNAWVAFTPSDISLCPVDDTLLAVATSSVPHMKLIVVRLLLPKGTPIDGGGLSTVFQAGSASRNSDEPHDSTIAAQARAALALQDREASAIILHCNTFAPQTVYSTPRLAWRPDGSGIWVSSDDGVVRGIEVSSGRVVESLSGHEPGCKIRCLWAGMVKTGNEAEREAEEWLISGGFDQKLIVWRCAL